MKIQTTEQKVLIIQASDNMRYQGYIKNPLQYNSEKKKQINLTEEGEKLPTSS